MPTNGTVGGPSAGQNSRLFSRCVFCRVAGLAGDRGATVIPTLRHGFLMGLMATTTILMANPLMVGT